MKKTILIAVILVGLCKVVSANAQYFQYGESALQQGEAQFELGNFQHARTLFEQAISYFQQAFNSCPYKDPQKQFALRQLVAAQLGRSLSWQGPTSQAIVYLSQAQISLAQQITRIEQRIAQIERTITPEETRKLEEKVQRLRENLQALHEEVKEEQHAQRIAQRPPPSHMYL